jgi:EmrB/QacA subfamily drug resistance transporter
MKDDVRPAPARPLTFLSLFPSIMLPMFLALVDQTIVVTALPAIGGDLGGIERMSWVIIAYLISTTVMAPVYGYLGDRLGRRRLLLVALGIFGVASILCALSTSMTMLTVARVGQGLGGGGLMALSQALVGETVAPRDRARYQGWLATIGVSASTIGPLLGGYLTEHFGWRSIFLVNLPVGCLAALLVLRLPDRRNGAGPFRFDYAGLALFAGFIVSTLLLLERVQHLAPVASPGFVGLAVAAVGALVLLLYRERRATAPLLPIGVLGHPAIWRSDLLAALHGAMLVSLLTFVPIYLRVVHGTSAAETGFLLLPMTVAIGIGSLLTGRIVSRTGRTAIFPSCGLVVVAVALAYLALRSPWLSARELSWLLSITAFFMGTVMSVVQVTVQSSAGPSALGSASASVQFSRSLGAAFGTALVAAVLFALLAAGDARTASLLGAVLQHGPGGLDTISGADRLAVQGAFADAFRAAFLTTAVFAAAAAVLTWTIPMRRL